METALARSQASAFSWNATSPQQRAAILERAAQLFERDRPRLMAAIIRESGKPLQAAHDEVRDAVDALRYYANEARHLFGAPLHLKSPTGETNRYGMRARGPFACISPWNSPLAAFTGQIAAALGAGNPVLAKPSEHTPVTAFLATQRLLEAGVPEDALHLLPGDAAIGHRLLVDPRIGGVAFTGSPATAWTIQKTLAERRGAFIPFIAATGGLNAMIADSTALPEHIVRDAIHSAFSDSGLRCTSATVLFVQEEIAAPTIEMLAGAIQALDIDDPLKPSTDIGPVITEALQDHIDAHKHKMHSLGRELADSSLPESCRAGNYVTPAAFEVDTLDHIQSQPGNEIFGPVLHVIRFTKGHLNDVIDAINRQGYGMTLALHSRIDSVADFTAQRARVGNLFVNRDQIGLGVGVRPIGGEGLSGTGAHSGGPGYMPRFASEFVRTTDITATGGNLDLLRRANAQRAELS